MKLSAVNSRRSLLRLTADRSMATLAAQRKRCRRPGPRTHRLSDAALSEVIESDLPGIVAAPRCSDFETINLEFA
ncbi:hypothetical protein [Sphingomonas sp. GC_Shp_3]|uniref:hypothetical protein n=1 Tax=Sphingomonas sp. GC_Shp_3 TaxID=2937383 RepID=UPI002269988E|nr:hypothetical protein [Sphingomonas sp. GC_Shp_3]